VEGALTALIGEAGRRIHTARSRNDQVATLLVMFSLDSAARLQARLGDLTATLCRRARDWSDWAMPMQTHQQHAAPGSCGFWALRFAVGFQRIAAHLDFLQRHWRAACPLGSAAVAGSTLPIDREVQAAELGFAAPSLNALASTSGRDECLELLAVLAQVALHLQSFATDVIGFAQSQLGWVKYPPAFGTGSSMMPNKTNPDAMELLRGTACGVLAAHAHALTLLKALPSGYNRDLQCIKPLVRNAVAQTLDACELAEAFIDAMDFDRQNLAKALSYGHIDATARMEAKVAEGAALRDAHHAVADELGGSPDDPDAVAAVLPAYRTIGSAAPAETRRIAELLLSRARSAPKAKTT